ncbi:hypothetical protein L914_01148 [Phytophthora nicotianae]|uniref:Uncharacterized protein n=1 Tax=Phytophthora nicotianae TaxID=4792 RepID=W2P6T4_PHYNI|nr:hypothetical protein L914_01148 [Phytophthora nicotianae]
MGGTADLNFLPSGTGSDADALLFGGCMLPECDPLLCGLSELQFLVPGRRPQESGHRTLNTAMVGLSAAQLPPMKLYAGDTIAYHTQIEVSLAQATHLPACLGRVPAPSDRTRFAESVQNIITAAFTGAFTGGPATEAEVASKTTQRSNGSDGDDQVSSMTSSAPTTAATVVDHAFTDAHEYDDEYAYEERAPVPTPTNKVKAKTKSKKTALRKRPRTPPPLVI